MDFYGVLKSLYGFHEFQLNLMCSCCIFCATILPKIYNYIMNSIIFIVWNKLLLTQHAQKMHANFKHSLWRWLWEPKIMNKPCFYPSIRFHVKYSTFVSLFFSLFGFCPKYTRENSKKKLLLAFVLPVKRQYALQKFYT